jgi:nicotinamidase/pyrazinamidase
MKTALFDVDTQLDFVCRAGALYAPGADALTSALARLTQYARIQRIPLLSTADAHSEDDPEFNQWPPHCVADTFGQQKLGVTLLDTRYVLTPVPSALDRAAASGSQQVIIEKQHVDCFTNPNLTNLLALIDADRYVVYGVVTDVCVFYAAHGLLQMGKSVEIVRDGICASTEAAGANALNRLTGAGATLTSVADVIRS